MGDTTWVSHVERLAAGPSHCWPSRRMRRLRPVHAAQARVTHAGREVLWGRADAVWMNGMDRWIGGVHLSGREIPWRWDADEECIVQS